uniref:CHK kinase-like domain-containing protein n=1 Tax=Heliothis virescens TaxID=7102 RepID=A0A2A4JDV8_HELVI
MAQYKFEGDFKVLNERQVEFINKVVTEQNLKAKRVIFEAVGQAGDNFIGTIKRIVIEGENGSMKLIAKVAASNEMARFQTNTEILFRNEHILYTELLPKLVQLQEAAGVPEEERLRYAKCYGSFTEAPNEIIILEDLNESDFTMLNKFESLSDECVRNVLKGFAVFHSLSHVLKKQEPEKYDEIKEKLTDVWNISFSRPEMEMHGKLMETETLAILDDVHKPLVENKLSETFKNRAKIFENDDQRYTVIQQGDAWTNNIMFKLGKDSIQSIMIDYQFSTNGNAMLDFLYMIFNCTDHETRVKHYLDWVDYYYSELDKSLSNFGLKASSIYPKDQMDADIKKCAKYMFYHCILFAHILMRDSSEANEVLEAMKNVNLEEAMDSFKAGNLQSATVKRIKTKIENVIASYELFGLF